MNTQMGIDQVLAQMRQIRQASGLDRMQELAKPQNEAQAGFGQLFSQAVNGVNALQSNTSKLQSEYIASDGATDITRVMVAAQKSSVAFQATVQVRNKLLEAYKEIMSMPV